LRLNFLAVELLALATTLGSMMTSQHSVAMATTVNNAPAVDADVRTQVMNGRARVLVQLRVENADNPATRDKAIADAQDVVLSRVPAVLVRRYLSVPLLALEIDAAGLRALDTLGDVVSRVESDRALRKQ
jgi:hypothetical protein